MRIPRESVYTALFSRLQATEGPRTFGRRLKHWGDVQAVNQPALFLTHRHESAEQRTGVPPKWTLVADVYLYVNAGNNPDAVPGIRLNELIDAVETALAPDDPRRNVCTLGGLVAWCRIEGEVQTDEGLLGPQAVAIIPIHILVP